MGETKCTADGVRWYDRHNKLIPYFQFRAHIPFAFVAVGAIIYLQASAYEWLKIVGCWFLFASMALTSNHRYFAHASFDTSRPFRFVLALLACLGMQHGPLWWSSKHRKHHKKCDLPGDPHSWKQTSWWYAWWGWVYAIDEQQIDVQFLHPSMFTKSDLFPLPSMLCPQLSSDPKGKGSNQQNIATELLLADKFWWAPFVLVQVALFFAGVPARSILFYFTGPCINIPLPILLFNVMFHPPTTTPTKAGCFALDSLLDPAAFLFGEAHHQDHHIYPARAKRPGLFDVSWICLLKPLLAVGLIWDPKMMLSDAKHV